MCRVTSPPRVTTLLGPWNNLSKRELFFLKHQSVWSGSGCWRRAKPQRGFQWKRFLPACWTGYIIRTSVSRVSLGDGLALDRSHFLQNPWRLCSSASERPAGVAVVCSVAADGGGSERGRTAARSRQNEWNCWIQPPLSVGTIFTVWPFLASFGFICC